METALLHVSFTYPGNNLICIGVQVERLQGIINKLTAENVEYRDNNKTQQFEVRIQELQQMLKQTGELLNLLFKGAMRTHCYAFFCVRYLTICFWHDRRRLTAASGA